MVRTRRRSPALGAESFPALPPAASSAAAEGAEPPPAFCLAARLSLRARAAAMAAGSLPAERECVNSVWTSELYSRCRQQSTPPLSPSCLTSGSEEPLLPHPAVLALVLVLLHSGLGADGLTIDYAPHLPL